MTLLFALLSALPAQESADDLKKEVEKLRTQNRELEARLTQLEADAVRDAEKIQRLRAAIKALETASKTEPPKPADGIKIVDGPSEVIKGRVIHVEPRFNFLLAAIPPEKNLQPGYKFDIVRQIYDKDRPDDPRLQKIGAAEFEKLIEGSAKLKVTEGNTSDMKLEDEAVAIRALPPKPPAPVPGPREPNGLYKITGTSGTGFIVNYGTLDKAKQTDLVFIYKDGVLKGKLRLDSVMKEFSVGSLLPQPKDAKAPEVGDQIFTRELQRNLTGKVALVDEKVGRVATDLRERDGVKPGQRLEVRRLGQRVGSLLVTEVQQWGSWTKPEGETKIEQIQKGDFVEAAEGK